MAFTANSQTLASGDANGVVKIWNLSDGTSPTSLLDTGNPVVALDYSRDGAMLAVLSRDPSVASPIDPGAQTIKVWRTSDWSLLKTLDGRVVRSLQFAPDRRSLVAAPVLTGFANVWDTTSWSVRTIFDQQAANAGVFDMALSPDGRFMVTVGGDFNVWRWTFDGTLIGPSPSHFSASIQRVAISPDSTTIATAGMLANQLELWNMSDGSYITMLADSKPTIAVTFLPDGKTLMVTPLGDDVKTVRVADGMTTKYPGRAGGALAPDGNRVASAQPDWSVQIWCLRP